VRSHLFAMGIVILLVSMSCSAKSEIVFDNITGTPEAASGIEISPGYQWGNFMSLAGTSREVTRLDIMLYEFGFQTAGDLTFKVNFWDAVGLPGSLLWTSPAQRALFPNRTLTVFSIEVPGIRIPDTFGLTVEGISNLNSAAVLTAYPPTVGTMLKQISTIPPSPWRSSITTSSGVGFRVFAVPEPATSMLVVFAAAAFFRARPLRRYRQN
jgi:hypothetical protein